jgi:hypothetical protein
MKTFVTIAISVLAGLLVDTRLKRLKTEMAKAKPTEGKNEVKKGNATLKAIGKVDDFSNHEDFIKNAEFAERVR